MKIKLIILVIALVIAGGAGYLIADAYSDGRTVASFVLSRAALDLGARSEVKPLTNVIRHGSLELSYNGEDGIYLGGKAYFSDSEIMLEGLKTNATGTDIDADVRICDDYIYLTERNILEDTYGIARGEAASDLEASIFAPDSGSKYALTDKEYSALHSLLSDYDKDGDLTDYVCERLKEILISNAAFTTKITDEKRVTEVILTCDGTARVLTELYEFLSSDGRMRKLAEKIDKIETTLTGGAEGSFIAAYDDYLAIMGGSVKSISDSLSGNYEKLITLSLTSSKYTLALRSAALIFNGETVLTLDAGEAGLRRSDEITVSAGKKQFIYETDELDRTVRASLRDGVTGGAIMQLSADKNSGTYTLTAGETAIGGKLDSELLKTDLTLDYISSPKGYESVKLSLTVREVDVMPKALQFAGIDEITDADVKRWIDKIYD